MDCVGCGIPLREDNTSETCSECAGPQPRSKKCPFCKEQIIADASKCKHCGEYLDTTVGDSRYSPTNNERDWSPSNARALSYIPGLGHIYKGKVLRGLAWMIIVALGYICFIVPGIFLHIWCIKSAANVGTAAPIPGKRRSTIYQTCRGRGSWSPCFHFIGTVPRISTNRSICIQVSGKS
jgi:hypothetical protein